MKKSNYLKPGLLVFFLVISSMVLSQNFTWMKGSSLSQQQGAGTLGVPASSNTPGARHLAASWKDGAGNFWIFGGYGYTGTSLAFLMTDFWKYSPASNQWTWMNGNNASSLAGIYGLPGIPSSFNFPGGRMGAASWTDASGNLWLFGGQGVDASTVMGQLNDLWKYNVVTNQWTWMSGSDAADPAASYGTTGVPGSTNTPGGRSYPGTWTDPAGNLYLFGGFGVDASGNYGYLNDLWRYNINTGQWTWLKGSNNADQTGSYGSTGAPSNSNSPGGRNTPSCWRDASGFLWLFGGYGMDSAPGVSDLMNDLWKYDPGSNQWTWVKGSNLSGAPGVYGQLGNPATANVPGARAGSPCWEDSFGYFYLFGGNGYDGQGNFDMLNDLWKYNPVNNQWTWMNGSNQLNQNGVYGTQGVASATNMPGARANGSAWIDGADNLWLFGGLGYDQIGSSADQMNDLWKIGKCDTSLHVNVVSSSSLICAGGSVSLTASGAASYLWNNNQTGALIVVTPSTTGPASYTVSGSDAYGCIVSAATSLTVAPLPTVLVSSARPMICRGENVTLTASGANNYSWSTIPASTGYSVVVSPTVNTVYTVTGVGTNSCIGTFSINQLVSACTGLEGITQVSETRQVYPNPGNGSFNISGEIFENGCTITIYNSLGQIVHEGLFNGEDNHVQTTLSKGVYYFNIQLNHQIHGAGKFAID